MSSQDLVLHLQNSVGKSPLLTAGAAHDITNLSRQRFGHLSQETCTAPDTSLAVSNSNDMKCLASGFPVLKYLGSTVFHIKIYIGGVCVCVCIYIHKYT